MCFSAAGVDVLTEAAARREAATTILRKLRLFERWSAVGRPVLVGAASYDLMIAPDIDLEIFCPGQPRTEDGFAVLAACATDSDITHARFANRLDAEDEGLYWQLRYRHGGEVWKIDMWALREDHPGPSSSWLVEPMRAVLTTESRRTILTLKRTLAENNDVRCGSIHIYRAVLEDGVTTVDEFRAWRAANDTESLTTWIPS